MRKIKASDKNTFVKILIEYVIRNSIRQKKDAHKYTLVAYLYCNISDIVTKLSIKLKKISQPNNFLLADLL